MPVTQSGSGGCGIPVFGVHKLNVGNASFCPASLTSSSIFILSRFNRATALDGILVSDGGRISSQVSWGPPGAEDEDREGLSVFVSASAGKFCCFFGIAEGRRGMLVPRLVLRPGPNSQGGGLSQPGGDRS